MHIKLQPLIINSEDTFQKDALKRKENAEILTEFIKSFRESYVIAIDSPWGTGKTTFLQMWQAHLKNNNVHSLYFNAWATDFNDDALIAIIKEMELHLENYEIDAEKKANALKYLKKAKEIGYGLIKKGIPVAVKLATQGLVDMSDVAKETISDMTKEIAEEQFVLYEKTKESLADFKKNLEKFSEEVSADGPLVFIVDELDRCRPDYAVQVLEKIKHLFSIKNLVFVLGIDKKQIGCSLETLYGVGMDVPGYLDKFIDFEYNLPKPDNEAFIKFTLERYGLDDFFNARNKSPELQHDKDNIVASLSQLFSLFDFSLREIEQIISQIVVVIRVTPENHFLHPIFLSFLLILRKKKPDLYQQIKDKKVSATHVIDSIKLKDNLSEFYSQWIRAYLETSLDTSGDIDNVVSKYNGVINNTANSPEQIADAKRMIQLIDNFYFKFRGGNILEFLVKKIEIAHRFK